MKECNPNKKCIILIFYDNAADILSNKQLNAIIPELLIRGTKLNNFLVFIAQFYFIVQKNIRLNFMLHFIIKIPKK